MAGTVVAGQPRVGTQVNLADWQRRGKFGDPLAHQISAVLQDLPGTSAEFRTHLGGAINDVIALFALVVMAGSKTKGLYQRCPPQSVLRRTRQAPQRLRLRRHGE